MKRTEYVSVKDYDDKHPLRDLVCVACGAIVIAPVKHAQFHQRIDKEFWENSDLMIGPG